MEALLMGDANKDQAPHEILYQRQFFSRFYLLRYKRYSQFKKKIISVIN